jgi:hypothetical protein
MKNKAEPIMRTNSDLSLVLFNTLMPPKPNRKPKAWQEAKIYPADEDSSIGKANCEPYIIKVGSKGMAKTPVIPPST